MSFKNTLIILTTNVGSSVIAKGGGGIGFELDNSAEGGPEAAKYSRIRGLVMEELKVCVGGVSCASWGIACSSLGFWERGMRMQWHEELAQHTSSLTSAVTQPPACTCCLLPAVLLPP